MNPGFLDHPIEPHANATRGGLAYLQMLVSPHFGGGEKVAIDIHRKLAAAHGDAARLLLPPGGETERIVRQAGLHYSRFEIERLTSPSRVRSGLEQLRLLGAVPGKGILHVHAPFLFGATRLLRSISRLRTVLHLHLECHADDLAWPLALPPDAVVVCAGFMRSIVEEALGNAGISNTEIWVVRNAVDAQSFSIGDRQASRRAIGLAEGTPLAVIAANLSPHKGQETAIRSVRLLKDRGRNVHLWLVGIERDEGGAYRARLETLVETLGVGDRVRFAGFRDDMPRIWQAADFALLPSTSEGLPLTLLEAQACGAVVLAAPTGGIPEIVADGRTGFLVAAEDARGYAAHMERLLDEPAHARELASRARSQIDREHSFESFHASIHGLYDHLITSTVR